MSESGKRLSKAQILEVDDRPETEVEVPEWGGVVFIRALSGTDRDSWEQSVLEQHGEDVQVNMAGARAKLAALSIVDADGERMFSEDEIDELSKKSGRALDRIFSAARKLNGITKEDVDELVGKSEDPDGSDSPSGSPSNSDAPDESFSSE